MSSSRYFYIKFFAVVIVISLMNGLNYSNAQNSEVKIPSIADHQFVPFSFIESPFINTHLQMYTGVGKSRNLQFTVLSINDDLSLDLSGDVTYGDFSFEYQQRVRDWMAMYIKYAIGVRMGTDVQSIVFQGLNTVESFELGWKIKIIEGNKYMLSANMNIQNHTGNFSSIIGYIRDVIDSVPGASLSQTVPILAGEAGLRYAYAINELIGFRAEWDLNYGETYDRSGYGFRSSLSGAIDFNFLRRYNLPLGLVASYKITSEPESVMVDNKYAHLLSAKIAYTGSRDFSLGIEGSYIKLPLPGIDDKPSLVSIGIHTKFFF